jgi:hypothetical protein
MAHYTVRVELEDTPHDHSVYVKLHKAMAGRGFKRTVDHPDYEISGETSKNVTFKLPVAEYRISTSNATATAKSIGLLAREVAASVWNNEEVGIVVTRQSSEKDSFWIDGLDLNVD